MMPNKTIYVADADLPIFEKAQELAGNNLSATIAQALRHYVQLEEARTSGFEEITVRVGAKGTYTQKRFLGRLLARRRESADANRRMTRYQIYQTPKGRFVKYTRTTTDWSNPATWTSGPWDWNWDIDWPFPSGGFDPFSQTPQAPHPPHMPPIPHMPPMPPMPHAPGWSAPSEGTEMQLEVYETADELKERIPLELYATVQQALQGDTIEDLDI